jgi:hypothetical protein
VSREPLDLVQEKKQLEWLRWLVPGVLIVGLGLWPVTPMLSTVVIIAAGLILFAFMHQQFRLDGYEAGYLDGYVDRHLNQPDKVRLIRDAEWAKDRRKRP